MTVTSTQSSQTFTSGQELPLNFQFLDNDDLVVTLIDPEGNEQELTLNTDYTVAGAGNILGTVYLNEPIQQDYWVRVDRSINYTQPYSFRDDTAFDSVKIENALDRIAMMGAQLTERISALEGSSSIDLANYTVQTTDQGVFRTLKARFSDTVNFLDYYDGTLGTNYGDSPNCTGALLAAVEAAKISNQRILYLPQGGIRISSDLDITGIILRGPDVGRFTIFADAAWEAGPYALGSLGGCGIENVTVDGNGVIITSIIINPLNSESVFLRNVDVSNCEIGIDIYPSPYIALENVSASMCSFSGITIGNGRVSANGIYVSDIGSYGVTLDRCSGVVTSLLIDNANMISDVEGSGLYLSECVGLTINNWSAILETDTMAAWIDRCESVSINLADVTSSAIEPTIELIRITGDCRSIRGYGIKLYSENDGSIAYVNYTGNWGYYCQFLGWSNHPDVIRTDEPLDQDFGSLMMVDETSGVNYFNGVGFGDGTLDLDNFGIGAVIWRTPEPGVSAFRTRTGGGANPASWVHGPAYPAT